jgi:hypothetical protein
MTMASIEHSVGITVMSEECLKKYNDAKPSAFHVKHPDE